MDYLVNTFNIEEHTIGLGCPCFIIAEAGVNHNGDLKMAEALIEAAASAGADAVKFQTFKTEHLVTSHAPKATYQQHTTDASESQFDMLKRLELSEEAHHILLPCCRERGVIFISTPFEEHSADFLATLGVSAFKIPSGEITNLPFLTHIAHKKKPLIMSTGMAKLGEVEMAVETVLAAGNNRLALLHCVSNYPADPADTNLRAMATMATAFGCPVGYSDHTEGIEIAMAAVSLGACIIEKHFTLDRTLPGPDHKASLEPDELKKMVQGIRKIEQALGNGQKKAAISEMNSAQVIRKSLVAAQNIPTGAVLSEAMIAIKRPGTGLPPTLRPYLVGRTARHDIPAGTLLNLDMFA